VLTGSRKEAPDMDNTSPTVNAIPTRYAGCHFRSRLEARWAVFFDHLGIRWEYEPQGFHGLNFSYLPDFLLPDINPPVRSGNMTDDGREPEYHGTFVEVKGSDAQLRADSQKIGDAIDFRSTPVAHGLLILGPIPRVPDNCCAVGHSFLSWHKGVEHNIAGFVYWQPAHTADLKNQELQSEWFAGDIAMCELPESVSVDAVFTEPTRVTRATKTLRHRQLQPEIAAAYTAARSARFEHGQSGPT
jgi:hypothetical protein